jgi:DNA-binding MarR family transcriptional regulator
MNQIAFSMPSKAEHELARLQRERDGLKRTIFNPGRTQTESAPTSENDVRAILRARRKRESLFGKDLFADPAWDILLELYAAELGQRRTSTTDLSDSSGVPPTTALRWIARLHRDELITREDDPLDGRRVRIAFSQRGLSMMQCYFESIGQTAISI